jgi:hypothetical protein
MHNAVSALACKSGGPDLANAGRGLAAAARPERRQGAALPLMG